MKTYKIHFLMSLLVLAMFSACTDEDGLQNDVGYEAEVILATVDGMVGEPIVDDQIVRAYLVLTVGEFDDLSALSPEFVTTEGTTIEPASGSTHDFTEGTVITYTVTAANGRTKEWFVTIINFIPPVIEVDPKTGIFDFEDGSNPFTQAWVGGSADIVDNPYVLGLNQSNKVAHVYKVASSSGYYNQSLALIGVLAEEVGLNLDKGLLFTLDVYNPNPDPAANIVMKFEFEGGGDVKSEVPALVTAGWQRLFFDFSNADLEGKTIAKITWHIDIWNDDTSREFYWDNFTQHLTPPVNTVYDYEDGENPFTQAWVGGTAEVIDNPEPVGINQSAKVARISKVASSSGYYNQSLALIGVLYEDVEGVDLDNLPRAFRMKVYNPNPDPANIVMKFEFEGGGDVKAEVPTTQTGVWETLTFDFSTSNLDGKTIAKITWHIDIWNDDTSRFFYWDDLEQLN